jgi:hypothetical protein
MRYLTLKSVLAGLFLFTCSLAHADDQRVLKVFILKMTKPAGVGSALASQHPIDNMEFDVPTDAELKAAMDAIEKQGIKPEDLAKNDNKTFMLESFLFEVKKAVPGVNPPAGNEVNGVLVEKATDDDLEKDRKGLKNLQGIEHFFEPFEMQIALGGAFPLSYNLAHSYHDASSFSLGFGYQFFPTFSLLLNVDGSFFNSSNDARTNGGFQLQEATVELLAKLRFASKGVRPYIFGGPALSFSEFQYTFSNSSSFDGLSVSNYGNTTLSDNGHFSLVGGLGLEVPLGKIHLYVQSEVIDDFVGSNVASFGTLDQPMVFVPIEAGVVFGR